MMEEMATLREQGRAAAWGAYHGKLMRASHIFIATGLASIKDINSMLLEIESFRKSESGTQQAPGDFLSDWLNGRVEKRKVKVQ